MKCSPFLKGLRKGGKHIHHQRGKFMKHLMRRCMDGLESSTSEDEHHLDRRSESGNEMQHRMEHDHRHGRGMMHGRRYGHHGMMYRMRHGHDKMHGMRHGHDKMHGMRHGHDMMNGMRYGHDKMHEMRHGHDKMHGMRHGHDKMHGMRHGDGMKYWDDMKHTKKHNHGMEHRMKHSHDMKHRMHHGHGRKHKIGHGPGMQHKLRHEVETSCSENLNEERPFEVNVENANESSDNEAFTFYKPKTSALVVNENNKFQICLETSYYQPEEVSIKIVDGKIEVSALHESKEDGLYEFHEMYRSFDVPNNVNPEVITSRLDADGKLFIEAVCNDQEESLLMERNIPVIRVSE